MKCNDNWSYSFTLFGTSLIELEKINGETGGKCKRDVYLNAEDDALE